MRIAQLDAFAGVSGDMLLGAFIQAGASVTVLRDTLQRLELGATLEVGEVDRCGIHAVKVNILVDGQPAEHASRHRHSHPHNHNHDQGHSHSGLAHHEHHHQNDDVGHVHSHGTQIEPERTLSAIRQIIRDAQLPRIVEETALRTFELLAAAEAKIHHVPVEAIHFHEVGAVDAIADIVLAAAAAHSLGIEAWYCSALNVGAGTVQCAHGRYPVPAPATAELLRDAPTYSSGPQMELVTPTGAALVRAFGSDFGMAPSMRVSAIGYGAGSRNPPGFANVVRLRIGEAAGALSSLAEAAETVLVLEAAVDDLNPQVIAYVTERALKAGALDVMCTPVVMKKGRPGTLITVLSDWAHAQALENLLLSETSTLGLRIHEERRVRLEREHVTVATEWGPVRVKVGRRGGQELNAAPEFEDCRALAETKAVPLKRVIEAALQAYRKDRP